MSNAAGERVTEPQAPLACPFCGGDRLYISAISNTGGNLKHVWCPACQAQGPTENGPPENAIAAWNRRPRKAMDDKPGFYDLEPAR